MKQIAKKVVTTKVIITNDDMLKCFLLIRYSHVRNLLSSGFSLLHLCIFSILYIDLHLSQGI